MNSKRMLSAHEWIMHFNTDQLDKYIKHFEEVFSSMQASFEKEMDEFAGKLPEEERGDWYEWNSDKHSELNHEFPRIHNNSLFVTIYSYYEAQIKSLCTFFENITDAKLKCNHLNGKGIKKYCQYLKLMHDVSFPDDTTEWQDVNLYRTIRNCIVHTQGKLGSNKNAEQVKKFAKDNADLITIDQHDSLTIQFPFNYIAAKTIRSSLQQIFDASKAAIG